MHYGKNLSQRVKRTYLVFLGAGASIPIGFPGSAKLVNTFMSELTKTQESDKRKMLAMVRRLEKLILNNGFSYDSESLYSCLEGYSTPSKWMQQSGPFPSSMCKIQPVTKIRPDPFCNRLRSLFEEFLVTKFYNEDPFLKRRIKVIYNRLFSKISGVADWKNSEPDWASSTFEVFTTNFDRAVETYSDQVNQAICMGYRIAEDNRVMFTPDDYEHNPASLKLYKLHGSVELSALDDDTIISQLPPAVPGQTYKRKSIVSKVMVYGIQKNIISEPYFELLAIFKKRLTELKRCLVIGYSFRDPWINQIFLDIIRNYPKMVNIELVGRKKETKIAGLPTLNKVVIQKSSMLEKFLELPTQGAVA